MSEVDPYPAPTSLQPRQIVVPPVPPWDRSDVPAMPDVVYEIPAMLGREERRYLAWLTATQYEGFGAIVDLGCWLGGSSCALAEGLKRAGRSERIHSFDLFQWEPDYMEKDAPLGQPVGWNFMPEFERRTATYRAWIEPHKVDLTSFTWTGGPIELLFVDAAKSWRLTNSILAAFGPWLVPGRSRVIFQDYRYYDCYFLLPIVESRPDVWRETEAVGEGTTVTFVPLRDLGGAGGLPTRYGPESFRFAGVEHIVRRRLVHENAANRHRLLRVLMCWAKLDGKPTDRERVAAELFADTGLPMTAAERHWFEDPASLCVQEGWNTWREHEFAAADRFVTRALDRVPTDIEALLLKIMIDRDLHGIEGAADALVRAEQVAPRDPRVVLWRLTLRATRHEIDGVGDQLLAMLHAGVPDGLQSWAIDLLHSVLQPTNDIAAMIGLGRSLLPRYANSAVLHARLAQGYACIDDQESSRNHIARALELEPGNTTVLQVKAALDKAGDPGHP